MAHYPNQRRWPLRWLPARCRCGLPRFDRCPDAVSDALSGSGAPRGGGYDTSAATLRRISAGLDRNDRRWIA